jgi:predicted lipid-binding transport protein (Tim44 family)
VNAFGILLIGILFVAMFLALSAMFMAMAPYLAVLVIIGGLCWLSTKAPDPEEKTRPRPPRWPHDPNDFR